MTLSGNDLVIIDSSGERHGYVLAPSGKFGEPVVHSKSSPSVPLNIGSSTPAQAGGQYDVRDADGDKAITHLDWTLGCGQRSLDAEDASPYRFWDSRNIDISQKGEISLGRDTEYTAMAYAKGPVFAALGYFWLGCSPEAGTLQCSVDGVTWVKPAITASPSISGLINTFATDGTNLYFGVASGDNKGIWKSSFNGSTFSFTKFGSTPGAEEVWGLAFNGGQMFAAVITTGGTPASRVAQVDITTGVIAPQTTGSALSTPKMFNVVTHVALVSAANSVYWIVSQGNQSYIYKIAYEPDTRAMTTEQYAEMPSGFVATSASGYLSTIYIGGYWTSTYSDVGKGSIYVAADGYAAPLLDIGEQPEDTDNPTDVLNDNRIYSVCPAGKDLFFVTNRGCYRWDIDGGGYSHVFDLHSGGAGETEVSWSAGSDYSWDCSDLTNEDPVHAFYPTKWSAVDTEVTDTAQKSMIKTTGGFSRGADTDAYFYFSPQGGWSASYQEGGGYTIGGADWTAVTSVKLYNVTTVPISTNPSSSTGGTFNCVITTNDPRVAGEGLDMPYKCTLTGKKFTSANISQKSVTGFNYGWPTITADVTRKPVWSFSSGYAYVSGGTGVKTTLTTVPDGDDLLVNATGSTFEIKVTSSHNGVCDITMVNDVVMAKARILKAAVKSWTEVEAQTPNGPPGDLYKYWKEITTYVDAIDIPVYGKVYYTYKKTSPPVSSRSGDVIEFIKVYTGAYGWSHDELGTTAANNITYEYTYGSWPFYGQQLTWVNQPFSARLMVEGTTSRINISGERTLRMVLKNSLLTASVNGDTATAVNSYALKPDTGGNYIEVAAGNGTALDYWKLNAQDAVPSQNEVEVLQYAGVAYNKGSLISPYSIPSAVDINPVVSSSLANPCVITCTNDHGWVNNDVVVIDGNSRSGVNGEWTITKTGDKTFTIPYNNASAGTGGGVYLKGAAPDGIARTIHTRSPSGWLTQSDTSFHTGSMLKDYRYITVMHNTLAPGASLGMTAWVDGEAIVMTGETLGKSTRFPLNTQGSTIQTRLTIERGDISNSSPVVKAINVVWDFVKVKKHQYILNCAAGAQNGQWREDPEEAIKFLFEVSDKRARFEDRFVGEYYGAIREVEFLEAPKSSDEDPSGVVKITTREDA